MTVYPPRYHGRPPKASTAIDLDGTHRRCFYEDKRRTSPTWRRVQFRHVPLMINQNNRRHVQLVVSQLEGQRYQRDHHDNRQREK
jgi:hypothetical protein